MATVGAAFAALYRPEGDGQDDAGLPAQCRPLEPLTDGCAATMTHDNKRHAISRRFVALAVKFDRVIGDCMPRRRTRRFLKLLHRIATA